MSCRYAHHQELLLVQLRLHEQTGLENPCPGRCVQRTTTLRQEARAELLPYNKTNVCSLKIEPRCFNLSIKYLESFYVHTCSAHF